MTPNWWETAKDAVGDASAAQGDADAAKEGLLDFHVQTLIADGAIDITKGSTRLDGTNATAKATLAAPAHDGQIHVFTAINTTNECSVDATNIWNSAGLKAYFAAPGDYVVVIGINGLWVQISGNADYIPV